MVVILSVDHHHATDDSEASLSKRLVLTIVEYNPTTNKIHSGSDFWRFMAGV
jgi:hypothetical protein